MRDGSCTAPDAHGRLLMAVLRCKKAQRSCLPAKPFGVTWMLAAAILLLGTIGPATASAQWFAGAATSDVTPPAAMIAGGEVYMGGYGLWTSRGAATGVHDSISAQALCIESGQAFCMVVIDSLGIPMPLTNAIKLHIAKVSRLPTAHVMVAATHTHAAPDLLGLWGGSPASYANLLVTRAAEASLQAWQNREPVRLIYTLAKAPSRNRRGWTADDEMVVLQALGEDGSPVATLMNFAAHPVVTPMSNLQLSSDYVGALRDHVTAATGAPALFVNGALGDASPVAPPGDTRFEQARLYGQQLGAIALDALTRSEPVAGKLRVRTTTTALTLDNHVLRFANWLGLLNEPMPERRVVVPLAHLALGDAVAAVTLPGEALKGFGTNLKAQLGVSAPMILGLTGGAYGYFVPEQEWEVGRNDNYEESLALSRVTAKELLEALTTLIQSR